MVAMAGDLGDAETVNRRYLDRRQFVITGDIDSGDLPGGAARSSATETI
jgi:hypothetical protein